MTSVTIQKTPFRQKDASTIDDLGNQLVEQAESAHMKRGAKEGPVSINRTLCSGEKKLLEEMMRNDGALSINDVARVLQSACSLSMAATGALPHLETPRLKVLIKRRKNHLHRIVLTIT